MTNDQSNSKNSTIANSSGSPSGTANNNTNVTMLFPKPSLQIVIVLYNSGPDLDFCLESLVRSLITTKIANTETPVNLSSQDSNSSVVNNYQGSHYILDKVTVMDNTPENPPNLDPWRTRLPIDYIASPTNIGFGKACNLGALRSQSEYILFLNPDCFVSPSAIDTALLHLSKPIHSTTAVTSVLLKSMTGEVQKTCARQPNLKMFINESLGFDRLGWSRNNPHFFSHHMREWHHKESKFVDHVIGAFYLIRRSVFTSLNGFDERFFVYLEDLDLSLRVHQAGHQIYFLTNDYAIHKGGGSSESVKAFRLCLSLESKIKYADKHFPRWQKWLLTLVIFTFEFLLRIAYSIKTDPSRKSYHEILQAYKMLWLRWKN